MVDPRPRRFLAELFAVGVLGAMGACGGSTTEPPSPDDEAAVARTVRSFYAPTAGKDAADLCRLLTENGRAVIQVLGGKNACDRGSPVNSRGPEPSIRPVGVEDDVALAVVRTPDRGSLLQENFVSVARLVDGRWLIDLPAPFPVPPSLPSPDRGLAELMVEELPTDGSEVDAARTVADRYTLARQRNDGATVCSLLVASARGPDCEKRQSIPISEVYHVAEVAVVGDIALAYRTGAGTPLPGQTQPDNPGQLQDILLLVKTPNGWRVNPLTFGFA
jgi:hypothetical protein